MLNKIENLPVQQGSSTRSRKLGKTWSVVAMLALVAGLVPALAGGAYAQGECQTFTQTNQKVCGKFNTYWTEHGGLAQQGYPISPEQQEKSLVNGKTYTTQYFER